MSVTIGSLYGEDQRILEDLELLPQWEESESSGSTAEEEEPTPSDAPVSKSSSTLVVPSDISTSDLARTYRHGTTDGIPWFEEMIEGSGLGKLMKRRRGAGVSDDQSTTIEWEVSEWTSTGSKAESSSAHAAGKRKRGEHTDIVDT